MFMLSSRKDFWAGTELSDTDAIRDVVLDDDGPGTPMSEAALLAEIGGRRVLLLIHGYNNEEGDVVRAYKIVEDKMRDHGLAGPGRPYDLVLGYTWPGGNIRLAYLAAKARASAVASRVTRHLRTLTNAAAALDVMTHSLGARVALLALQDITDFTIRNLWNLAAAVDNESIEKGEKFFSSTRACAGLYVLHSRNDPVLRTLFPLNDFDLALGYSGPEDPASIINHSPNVKVVNCKHVIRRHGDYKYKDEVYRYILNELTGTPSGQFHTL